jgi:hypothetical protein
VSVAGAFGFLALAASGLACATGAGGDVAGVPLYPNAQAGRLPREQVAQVAGPLAKIDDRDVVDQGGVFDLLPGCHIVELDRRVVMDPYALSGGVYLSGEYPVTIFALRMKPGARYVIRRDMFADSSGHGRITLFAREEEPTGATTELSPAQSADDVKACKQWEATTLRR